MREDLPCGVTIVSHAIGVSNKRGFTVCDRTLCELVGRTRLAEDCSDLYTTMLQR